MTVNVVPQPGQRDEQFQQIGPGAWVFEQPDGGWCLSNAGLICGREASLMVDSAATQPRAQSLRRAAKRLLEGNDPESIVLTHFHGDHGFGVGEFEGTSRVIATTRTTELLVQAGLGLTELWPNVDWGSVAVPVPNETFTGSYELDLGDCPVEIIELGAAHTGSDSVVWLPESRVLYAGDLVMSGVAPFFMFGSGTGMVGALEQLGRLKPAVVVAGHGPVGGPEVIEDNLHYVLWCLQMAQEGDRYGRTPIETARSISSKDHRMQLVDSERVVANLYRAHAELDGVEAGGVIEYQEAFSAMVAFAGGHLHCGA